VAGDSVVKVLLYPCRSQSVLHVVPE
jgi:hypothetical protein